MVIEPATAHHCRGVELAVVSQVGHRLPRSLCFGDNHSRAAHLSTIVAKANTLNQLPAGGRHTSPPPAGSVFDIVTPSKGCTSLASVASSFVTIKKAVTGQPFLVSGDGLRRPFFFSAHADDSAVSS